MLIDYISAQPQPICKIFFRYFIWYGALRELDTHGLISNKIPFIYVQEGDTRDKRRKLVSIYEGLRFL